MPTVPKVTQRAVPVRPLATVFQRDTSTLAAFGGGDATLGALAQGARQTADVLGGQVLAEAEQKNRRLATQAETRFREQTRSILYDGDETNRAYLNQRGAVAVQNTDIAAGRIRDAHREILNDPTLNQAARAFAERNLAAQLNSNLDLVARHSSGQERQAQEDAHQAELSSFSRDAQSKALDPQARGNVKLQGLASIDEHLAGQDKAVIDEAKQKFLTETNAGIAQEMIANGDFEAAEAFVEQTKGQTDPQVTIALQKEVRLAKNRAADADDAALRATQGEFLQLYANDELTVAQVLSSNLKPFGSGSQDTFLRMLDKDPKTTTTNPNVYSEAFRRVTLPDGHPDKITDENDLNELVVNQQLTMSDFNRLRDEIAGKRDPQRKTDLTLKSQAKTSAHRILSGKNPLLGIRDPNGEAAILAFDIEFEEEFNRALSEGKPASELLDPNDPNSLFSRILARHKRGPAELIQDLQRGASELAGTLEEGDPETTSERLDVNPPLDPDVEARAVDRLGNDETGEIIFELPDGTFVRPDGSPFE